MMITRRLKWFAMMVFSILSSAFSISFYNIWWHISIISRFVRTNNYLRANIDVTGLERSGLMCFILATLIIIITIIFNLYVWWKDEG